MVKENCGTWGSKPPNANFSFPKSSFKFLPIFLIRIRNVRASFQKSLEHEVLDQIGCRKQRSTSVQRLEDFLGILVGRSLDNANHEKTRPDDRGVELLLRAPSSPLAVTSAGALATVATALLRRSRDSTRSSIAHLLKPPGRRAEISVPGRSAFATAISAPA
jgi:hypothetical protein